MLLLFLVKDCIYTIKTLVLIFARPHHYKNKMHLGEHSFHPSYVHIKKFINEIYTHIFKLQNDVFVSNNICQENNIYCTWCENPSFLIVTKMSFY